MKPRQEELRCRNCEQTFDTPEELEEHEKECVGEQAEEEELAEAEQTQQEEEEGFSQEPNRQRQQKP